MAKKEKKAKVALSFTEIFNEQIDYLAKNKSSFTANNYRNVYHSFCRFMGNKAEEFRMEDVTDVWLTCYIAYIEANQKLSASSMNNYFCVLRALYNRAVKIYSIPIGADHPFDNIHIHVPTTLKRSLMKEDILRLIELDSLPKELQKALHLFLFLFYARGMCFIDVFNLRYDQINGDYICYTRSKTSAPLHVKIEKEMLDIMKLYREEGNPYVFPFLRRNQYNGKEISEKSSLRRINRQLGKIGDLLGIKLTTYVARHSWASMIQESGCDISIISQGMGHSSEKVTRTYLKGLPSYVIDNACSDMLDRFFRKAPTNHKKKCPILSKKETSVI